MTDPSGAPREEVDFINALLGRMLTLSVFLTGGGIFLLTDWTLGILFRTAVPIGLISFGCCLMGLEASRRPHAPDAMLRIKWNWFRSSALALFAALTLTLIAILIR
jgi:hypothetical protein